MKPYTAYVPLKTHMFLKRLSQVHGITLWEGYQRAAKAFYESSSSEVKTFLKKDFEEFEKLEG